MRKTGWIAALAIGMLAVGSLTWAGGPGGPGPTIPGIRPVPPIPSEIRGAIRLVDCEGRPDQVRVTVGGRTVNAEIDPARDFVFKYSIKGLPAGTYTVIPAMAAGVCPAGAWAPATRSVSLPTAISTADGQDFTYQVPRRRVTVPSAVFETAIRAALLGSSLTVTCDPTFHAPRASFAIPEGVDLRRVDLTHGFGQYEQMSSNPFAMFRFCVNNLGTAGPWLGSIEGGRIKVHVAFRDSNPVVKIYMKEDGSWSDGAVEDFSVRLLSADIFMTPSRDGRGRLSYSTVEPNLHYDPIVLVGGRFGGEWERVFRQYHSNNALRTVLEGTFRAIFDERRVKDRVADAISPPHSVGTITAVRGSGTSVEVEFRP